MLCNPGFLTLIQNSACVVVLNPVGLPKNISLFEKISSEQQQRCWEKSSTFCWHPSVLAAGSPWQQHSFPSPSQSFSHALATSVSRTPPVLKAYPRFLNSENYLFLNVLSGFPPCGSQHSSPPHFCYDPGWLAPSQWHSNYLFNLGLWPPPSCSWTLGELEKKETQPWKVITMALVPKEQKTGGKPCSNAFYPFISLKYS